MGLAIFDIMESLVDDVKLSSGSWGPYQNGVWCMNVYLPKYPRDAAYCVGQVILGGDDHTVCLVKHFPPHPPSEFAGSYFETSVSLNDPQMLSKVRQWLTELL